MLRNARTRAIVTQTLLLASVATLVVLLIQSTAANMQARGMPIGFDFLQLPARFVISEAILRYHPSQSYAWAIVVGIANTLFVSALVVVLSSALGLVVGVGRLNSNPLVVATCRVWVEIARNTPPIVLLIFLYSLWWKALPPVNEAFNPVPGVYASMRGVFVPSVSVSVEFAALAFFMASVLLAFIWLFGALHGLAQRILAAASAVLLIAAVGLANPRVLIQWPVFTGSNFRGGVEITPEIATIVVGLTLYTTGFIAEIVRSGILSIGKGQWEAGQALGLRRGQILRLLVIPQMLRVIMPPLNSQYINVVKNSTLAIAVGYLDFFAIMGTVINKSSHVIEGVAIILCVYLAINLSLSVLLNWYNRRIASVER